jgi:hypothetical protein
MIGFPLRSVDVFAATGVGYKGKPTGQDPIIVVLLIVVTCEPDMTAMFGEVAVLLATVVFVSVVIVVVFWASAAPVLNATAASMVHIIFMPIPPLVSPAPGPGGRW